MRFVPAIDDARFPVSASMQMKTIKMMGKQKIFLSRLQTETTTTIAGLHVHLPEIGYNLCQILMAMKSFKSPEMGLFISVDEKVLKYGYEVLFTSHIDRATEAKAIIPLLCLILEARFGDSIWNWFTNEAKEVSSQWAWDDDLSSLVPRIATMPLDEDDGMSLGSDDEYTQTMCDLFNVDTKRGNGLKFDLDFVISTRSLNEAPNQFGDSGSVKTFREECQMVDLSNVGPSLNEISCTDEETRATSTITDSTEDAEKALAALILSHPDLARKLLKSSTHKPKKSPTQNQKNQLIDNQSMAVSPYEGVDGSQK